MKDAQGLLEELENTNDIKKTIKILKKIKLNELSSNVLMKIRNIISTKDYVLVTKKISKKEPEVLLIIFALNAILPLTSVGLLIATFIDGLQLAWEGIALAAMDYFLTSMFVESVLEEEIKAPSKKQIAFIRQYQELLESLILKPTKVKESTIKNNEENNLDLINIIIRAKLIITTKCSENSKDKYVARLESLIESYKRKINTIDRDSQDAPSFASDYKRLVFDELEKNIEQLLQEIDTSQNYEQHRLETLIDTLNAILMVDDINQKILRYIELSNEICSQAVSEDIALNALLIETIAEYYLALIEQNSSLNLKWLLSQINPIYYDAILNLLLTRLNVTYKAENLDITTKIQNIESLSSIYISKSQGISANNMISKAI